MALALIAVLIVVSLNAQEETHSHREEDHSMLRRKTVALIIAPENFRDEELFVPKQEFEQAG
ncbi:MAG TPA: hypothetical protein PKO06_17800, partial [Candidatus Ozemobacteraceae bacterium]|nr:hypothetical protein [Candidatus Ozemobacteraceae bacterium]